MTEAIAIGPATREDIVRMQQIEVEAGRLFRDIGMGWVADDPPPSASLLGRHIDDGTAWTASDGAVLVGYVIASMVDDEGHVDQVSVDPSAAGRRIGEHLIDCVDAWAATQRAETVTLTTFRDVAWNGPYYRRLGFVEVAEDELGPELRAVRDIERAAGLDASPRVAMRRPIGAASSTLPSHSVHTPDELDT